MEPKLKDDTVGYTVGTLSHQGVDAPQERREEVSSPQRQSESGLTRELNGHGNRLAQLLGRTLIPGCFQNGERYVIGFMLFGFAHAELSVDMPRRQHYIRSSRKEVRREG